MMLANAVNNRMATKEPEELFAEEEDLEAESLEEQKDLVALLEKQRLRPRRVEPEPERERETANIQRIYLHSMGTKPLLTRDQEVELAKRLDEAKRKMRDAFLRSKAPVSKWMALIGPSALGGEEETPGAGKLLHLASVVEERVERIRKAHQPGRHKKAAQKIIRGIEKDAGLKKEVILALHRDLAPAAQSFREASEALVVANLKLVVSIASRYQGRGLSLLDLVQEGNIGLMRATESFSHEHGTKFSTYATWWIRQAITRALTNQARLIRVPVYVSEAQYKLNKAAQSLLQEKGVLPDRREVAKRAGLSLKSVREAEQIIKEPVSLSEPVGQDEESQLGEFIPDRTAPPPNAIVEREEINRRIGEVLRTLTPREERVVRLRFGLGEDREHTLEEVGQKLSVTRERIRQIENRALQKLRRSRRRKWLKVLLGEETKHYAISL
jgi:RNA polymerase primary sigma factor